MVGGASRHVPSCFLAAFSTRLRSCACLSRISTVLSKSPLDADDAVPPPHGGSRDPAEGKRDATGSLTCVHKFSVVIQSMQKRKNMRHFLELFNR